jgi:hypothetical protein
MQFKLILNHFAFCLLPFAFCLSPPVTFLLGARSEYNKHPACYRLEARDIAEYEIVRT